MTPEIASTIAEIRAVNDTRQVEENALHYHSNAIALADAFEQKDKELATLRAEYAKSALCVEYDRLRTERDSLRAEKAARTEAAIGVMKERDALRAGEEENLEVIAALREKAETLEAHLTAAKAENDSLKSENAALKKYLDHYKGIHDKHQM